MRLGTVSYRLDDLRKGVIIPIGMVGENDFTKVIFDAEDVYKYHPDAQVTMKVQPPKGGIYPATVTKDGNNVIWQVKAADLEHRGNGEIQLTFTADTMIEKSFIARTDIKRSLVGNGPAPDPVQDWVDNAEEVLEDLEAAEVHQPIIGLDGYWYTWNQGTGEYEKTNTKAQGQDGHSPVLTSSKSGKTTTIFADGDQLAQILDGEDGQGADVIDDTAGEGDTDKTWSANKLDTEITDVKSGIHGLRKIYNTVADMLADTTLTSGINAETKGYYAVGDNGHNEYEISSTHEGVFYLTLNNGLYANLLSEKGLLRCESIGMKAYADETAEPNENDMDRNVALFNAAIYNGILLLIGKGVYYFSSPVLLSRKNNYVIRGVSRDYTKLVFPSSNGLYFSDPIYYNYYVITGITIKSYGHCICCSESALTVLDSHFEWLYLISENGDGFHAPEYNISKYVADGGQRVVYDTCVQNCIFDFINVQAHNGAGIANVMGMYSLYKHFNFVSCKYAFRNCDGTLDQANTLSNTPGVYEDYFIYYDKTYSNSLKWKFINVNAEGIGKAFIYTEPEVQLPAGEDPKKPETANIMTLQKLTAIDSGWNLQGNATNNDVYPITAHRFYHIELINSDNLIAPTAYPTQYDTTTVKGQIKCTEQGTPPYRYDGSKDIVFVGANNFEYKLYGQNNRSIISNSFGHQEDGTDVPYNYSMISANKIYGGKATQIWEVKASEYNDSIVNPPKELYQFADIVRVINDTLNQKDILLLFNQMGIITPGRVITVYNAYNSTSDVGLLSPKQGSIGLGGFAIPDAIILKPNTAIHLISTVYTYGTSTYVAWKPIQLSRSEPSEVTVSGASPVINGIDGTSYYCGEVTNIEIAPPNEGTIEVYFTSGSTAATLTIPRSVSLPSGFDPSNLDTDTTYKIRIKNNKYGEVEAFFEQPYVNLLDPSTFVDNQVWWQGEAITGYSNNCRTELVAIMPGVKYILKRDSANQNMVSWFDENQEYISQEQWVDNTTKTIASGVHYVGISIAKSDKQNALLAEY